MRKPATLIVALLAVAMLLAIGCGGDEEPSPTPAPTAVPTPEVTLPPTTAPTVAPTVAPTQTGATETPVPDPAVRPCRFRGHVQLDGADVPDGTVITALIEGAAYTTTTPADAYGPSWYAILIPQPVGQTYEGKPISFRIGEHDAQSLTWMKGGNFILGLSASTT